jgi:hypothetical protein
MVVKICSHVAGTYRREGGLTSYRGHSQNFRAVTYKELETMKAAHKRPGVSTIDEGSALAGGGGGES